jgi:excinuclease ABC subunit B
LDYFPEDFLLIIDESHQTIPQLGAMCNGDRARKQSLVEYGFRLPSAYDNRPLAFDEFQGRMNQVIYVSATPAAFEITHSGGAIVEQILRPTGLLDPIIDIRPSSTQVDNCLEEIRKEKEEGGRILVTTLTKHLAEELTSYLLELGVKARYLHSDIDVLERLRIVHDLRIGVFDVLVGINLLREGLDIPEVSLVTILDADKEGFLRSETSLIQICGRAARNVKGRVIMYADKITASIRNTVAVTTARREKQAAYNVLHNITPTTIIRKAELLSLASEAVSASKTQEPVDLPSIRRSIKDWEAAMKKAAKEYRFEDAAVARDTLRRLQELELAVQKAFTVP